MRCSRSGPTALPCCETRPCSPRMLPVCWSGTSSRATTSSSASGTGCSHPRREAPQVDAANLQLAVAAPRRQVAAPTGSNLLGALRVRGRRNLPAVLVGELERIGEHAGRLEAEPVMEVRRDAMAPARELPSSKGEKELD